MTDSPLNSAEPAYVGFWIRLLASIIDSIPIFILLGFVLPLFIGSTDDIVMTDLPAVLQRLSIESILTAVIFIAFWMYFAATPGKMVFGAYIVDARTFRRASNAQLIVRYLCYYISAILFFLGFLWIAIDRRKQGWHDKIAGTVVIKGKPLDEQEQEREQDASSP